MEWFYPRRRGPGWKGQTVSSISAPPLPLLTVFGIVVLLLWLSQYSDYRGQMHQSTTNFQLLFILLPVLLIIFFAIAFSSSWRSFSSQPLQQSQPGQQPQLQSLPGQRRGGGGFPWRIAILLVVILVLVSNQSLFHSKWSRLD